MMEYRKYNEQRKKLRREVHTSRKNEERETAGLPKTLETHNGTYSDDKRGVIMLNTWTG